MEVHSEDYKDYRISIHKPGGNKEYYCYIFTGTFGVCIVDQYTASSGAFPTRVFTSIEDALDIARAYIDHMAISPNRVIGTAGAGPASP